MGAGEGFGGGGVLVIMVGVEEVNTSPSDSLTQAIADKSI